jgi:hypothetical protein
VQRYTAILLLAALLAACAEPQRAADAAGCPAPRYDRAAALRQLPGAGYECAEALARLLAAHPDDATVARLLVLARPPSHNLARRNALRALGRTLERLDPPELAWRKPRLHAELLSLVQAEDDASVLQDAIWILDAHLFPVHDAQPALAALAADPARPPPLRARAMNAVSRLILARTGPASPSDLDFVLTALRSDEPGVRARAALVLERWGDGRLDSSARALAVVGLAGAFAAARAEPLLPPEGAGAPATRAGSRFDPLFSGQPDVAVAPLAARAAVARALDRFVPAGRAAALRAAFEAAALPTRLERDGLVLRSALPPEELPRLLDLLRRARAEFLRLLGPGFERPLPGERSGELTLVVFGGSAAYQAAMQAFVGFGADVDGVFVEEQATLYTYARSPAQSVNTLEETLVHEYAHALAARHVFPGAWRDPGYHAEPKGWADEGLAELVAALALGDDAPAGEVCPRPPSLGSLLERRDGYDRFGTFAYHEAHALVRYLLLERPEAGRRVFAAFRDGVFRAKDVVRLTGDGSLAALEAEWHANLARRCSGAARS